MPTIATGAVGEQNLIRRTGGEALASDVGLAIGAWKSGPWHGTSNAVRIGGRFNGRLCGLVCVVANADILRSARRSCRLRVRGTHAHEVLAVLRIAENLVVARVPLHDHRGRTDALLDADIAILVRAIGYAHDCPARAGRNVHRRRIGTWRTSSDHIAPEIRVAVSIRTGILRAIGGNKVRLAATRAKSGRIELVRQILKIAERALHAVSDIATELSDVIRQRAGA